MSTLSLEFALWPWSIPDESYTQREEETPQKLDGVQQILPSLEVSGFLGGNRKPAVVVEKKQWGSCKTV